MLEHGRGVHIFLGRAFRPPLHQPHLAKGEKTPYSTRLKCYAFLILLSEQRLIKRGQKNPRGYNPPQTFLVVVGGPLRADRHLG